MVVVSGTWVKNVPTYPVPAVSDNLVIQTDNQNMSAKAVLLWRQNSHPFQDRTLSLDQPIKVGRSVARAKPAPNNAIFDCKVLSRHHAQLWYENGKFFLMDTKSSNGTFVNNNRLTAETEHEVSSGDIVQFGVDVMENNKKVTHGCIIATLKLYLPDGKETKASPSICEGDRHSNIPLDELYTLNQIIQEASQRERCLESKLLELQNIVEETKRSADESWQAYIGEERLLSRISALETRLQQLNKGWTDDKLREEIGKLREDSESYQTEAKSTLEKVYTEKMQAVSLALEQERAKLSAEAEASETRDLLDKVLAQLKDVAQKLSQLQEEYNEEKEKSAARIQELEEMHEEERNSFKKLYAKYYMLECGKDSIASDSLILDEKIKEELLAENEMSESIHANENGPNYICVTVAPAQEKTENDNLEENKTNEMTKDDPETPHKTEPKTVTFKLDEESNEIDESHNETIEKTEYDHIDSKTLKYQFQSAQNELKRKIECLENMCESSKQKIKYLEVELVKEQAINRERLLKNDSLKEEIVALEQKWKESCNENEKLKDKVTNLISELDEANKKINEPKTEEKHETEVQNKSISNNIITYDQLVNLEEELVLLKERYREISEEKVKVQHDLTKMREQYNIACNKTYNKYFFYIAPLVMMILYLLVSSMIS